MPVINKKMPVTNAAFGLILSVMIWAPNWPPSEKNKNTTPETTNMVGTGVWPIEVSHSMNSSHNH